MYLILPNVWTEWGMAVHKSMVAQLLTLEKEQDYPDLFKALTNFCMILRINITYRVDRRLLLKWIQYMLVDKNKWLTVIILTITERYLQSTKTVMGDNL